MKLADFDYELPAERIAQHPSPRRDRSRLLVVGRDGDEDRRFDALPELLRAGDLLVLNDTRVLPARLIGRKETGGRVEVLLLERATSGSPTAWNCLIDSSRKLRPGGRLEFDGGYGARVIDKRGAQWLLEFEVGATTVGEVMQAIGRIPLPPYIHRDESVPADEDRERYQTVFARHPGAVAAPTAGLHFTPTLLHRVEQAGVGLAYVTLHVGPGTFQPVRVDDVARHRMHPERIVLPADAAKAVQRTRARGGRVIAVGTTVVRTLEGRTDRHGRIMAGAGECDLFIAPGYRFRVVDALITNFHLPRSTLLMLVCAFAGRERMLAVYRAAVEREYRFYSYGDAMFVERQG